MSGETIRRLRTLLAPPTLADRVQAEAATTLHFILLGGAAVALFLTLTMPLAAAEPWSRIATYGTMFVTHLLALWRLRRGNVRAVAVAMTLFMFAFVTVNAQRAGGLAGVGVYTYPTVVIFAGLTWGASAAIGVALAASAAALGMNVLSPAGEHAAVSPLTPMGSWLLLTGIVAIISLMLLLALRSIRAAAQRERALQEHLSEAQKLEALGRLAGGVAHDFNNLLTVILMHTGLMKLDAAQTHAGVEPIEQAALRAAEMTQQLLALGRRQSVLATVVDVNRAVRDTVTLVRSLLPPHIHLRVQCGDEVGHTKMDAAGLERVVINLVINARDAMPDGGEIDVSTDVREIKAEDAQRADLPEGRYIRLVVRDNGPGISESIKERLFEPFATTKAKNGTGLGLASVRGIVRQSGGSVRVESAIGGGARFEILLPPTEAPRTETRIASQAPPPSRVQVLLLDDDPTVRAATRSMLESAGYDVTETDAGSGGVEAAVAAADVVLTDELALTDDSLDVWRATHPDARVAVMRKPFTRQQLLATLRAALDGP